MTKKKVVPIEDCMLSYAKYDDYVVTKALLVEGAKEILKLKGYLNDITAALDTAETYENLAHVARSDHESLLGAIKELNQSEDINGL